MSLSPDLTLIEKALDTLERREVRVLVWGLVDSALSEQEVDEALNEVLNRNHRLLLESECTLQTAPDLRQRLISLALLMEVPGRSGTPPRFRTRMAEGIRLLTRLRQMFPGRHDAPQGWIAAPTLVADYRLLWRPRRYPDRSVTGARALEKIEARISSTSTLAAVNHWIKKAAPSWQLAQFQIDAAMRILEGLSAGMPRGTIVAAGTGSGKTLAFYLPALSWLAGQKKASPAGRGVRILALYPRNELLKDQLAEVFDQSRKFDDYLGRAESGPISVGVLFGDTPTTLKRAAQAWRSRDGAVCPFFRCPACSSEMRLQDAQVEESAARLVCRCGVTVDNRQVRLTRRAMQADPPDILFTSVEMLNQRIADSDLRHLFGLGPKAARVPPLMLLDEVHVYSGTYGAQVAYLLRRWSSLTRHQTSFVGLSATIAEGKQFFAALTGMETTAIEEISPRHEDMVDEGAEYMLALRGDPVSQTALLSTSIQTLMLASRLLDRRQDCGKARPFAGWRAFAFTDQVDATNRLFYDLRDAEGRTREGHPATGRHPRGGLAHLRAPAGSLRRYEGGQDWRLVTNIGHDLATRHNVERTTAYHSGVDNDAEIVVATAALEVGYDDPAVGVVVHHKAPRDIAQFLQRKGRAGRTRHMRPWTIMVLSDYGRDRLAYQAYEHYFDPELAARELPLSNRYIRRMQATYALLDYLGSAMQAGEPTGSVWRDLSGPQKFVAFESWHQDVRKQIRALASEERFPLTNSAWSTLKGRAHAAAPAQAGADRWQGANWIGSHLRRRRLVELLTAVLNDANATDALALFLASALDLTRQEIDALLWDHPRPLLLGAIPTAIRRLATDWRAHGVPQADRAGSGPLPEFTPPTLFSDLSLPEVRLVEPARHNGRSEPYLPVLQALSELAPGKVSRRLDAALWLGPAEERLVAMIDSGAPEESIDVSDWYVLDPQSSFHSVEDGKASSHAAFRPVEILLSATPASAAGNRPQVLDTSNARMLWRSQLFGRRSGIVFPSPLQRVGIARLVQDVTVFTHASQSEATIRRYAVGSRVALRIRRGKERVEYSANWRFERNGLPCGIGFEIEADALRFRMQLASPIWSGLRAAPPEVQRAARTARYSWEAQHGEALVHVEENAFLRGWLAQIFQVAAITLSQEGACGLDQAFDKLASGQESNRLANVLTTIFQSPDAPEGEEGESPQNGSNGEPRLKKKLLAALSSQPLLQALRDLAGQTLTGSFDGQWDSWLKQAVLHTFGAALLDAIQQACPQIDPDDLAVDIEPGCAEDGSLRSGAELWVSETNPGGNGLIEQIVDVLATDTTQFYRRIETALGPSEFELIDTQLRAFLHAIGSQAPDPELLAATQAVRGARSSQEAQEHLLTLRRTLIGKGQAVFHGYIAALSNRVLRPDTPPALDELLSHIMRDWDELERGLGVEVEARVVCALFSRDARIDQAFVDAGFDLPATNRETWRFSMLLGVIWARGHALRANALPLPMRFSEAPATTDRMFLQDWLSPPEQPITAAEPEWLERVHRRLVQAGRAAVLLDRHPDAIHAAMSRIAVTPVQLEYLNVYPRLVSLVRGESGIRMDLELEATV